ncbi:hypothetical protein CCR75_007485 [Bremia lactucae]|uniref:rRNA adenine N(6)-methyltransferase n=1 Tax=Bremia lactucae TaxID=4779 RepID=A0A976ID16_BRELC|nr:hypothetical protein CCR75_007485 [Bremia lactucae]
MVEQLQLRFPAEINAGRLILEHSDFEDFRFGEQTDSTQSEKRLFSACVANIPSVKTFENYMHRFSTTFKCAVLLVQEEFALRLLAQPGDKIYSRLSANTALVADVTSIVKVPRKHFVPPPKVESRNKTLRALLLAKTARSQYLLNENAHIDTEDEYQDVTKRVEAALLATNLTSNRAVKVSVSEFIHLMHELHKRGIDLRPSQTRHFRN